MCIRKNLVSSRKKQESGLVIHSQILLSRISVSQVARCTCTSQFPSWLTCAMSRFVVNCIINHQNQNPCCLTVCIHRNLVFSRRARSSSAITRSATFNRISTKCTKISRNRIRSKVTRILRDAINSIQPRSFELCKHYC